MSMEKELGDRVKALEDLVRDLQGRIQTLEAAVDRSSLERIRYVQYDQPRWFISEGLGPK